MLVTSEAERLVSGKEIAGRKMVSDLSEEQRRFAEQHH
jgi:hypothetical protein